MKKVLASAVLLVVSVLFSTVHAQEKPGKDKEEKVIIIQKKSGPARVVTSDSVSTITINGEPLNMEDIARIQVWPKAVEGFPLLSSLNRHSSKAFLGVATKENVKGAEITQVTSSSPAELSGFQTGDIITKVGDVKVSNPQELAAAVQGHKPGDKVKIHFLRGKKSKSVMVVLASQPNSFSFLADSVIFRDGLKSFTNGMKNFNYSFNVPGIYFNNMRNTPSIGLQVQDTEDQSGVTVLQVAPGTAAEKAGVKVGDLITSVNGTNVDGVDQIREVMRGVKDNNYDLSIKREGTIMKIQVKVPKKLKKAEL